jgi:ribonucleotide monophosphatase NagD (HAD superfamily)
VGSTKREPTVVGKPSEFMLDNIASTLGLARSEICMVGGSDYAPMRAGDTVRLHEQRACR